MRFSSVATNGVIRGSQIDAFLKSSVSSSKADTGTPPAPKRAFAKKKKKRGQKSKDPSLVIDAMRSDE